MIKRPGVLIVAAVIVLLFLLVQVFFMVREGEVAVRTFLGKPVRAYTESGLYPKKPPPLERVYTFDNRLRTLETSYEETLTEDGKNVLVGMYAAWRIADPIKFLESVGTPDHAELLLDGLTRNHKSAAIGRHPFSALVNVQPEAIRFEEIEASILERVAPEALDRYGIEVTTVGIHRLGLPEDITESVFARMRAEREKLADQYRSEGLGEATSIRAEADSLKEQVLSKARADAKRIRAKGDAEAADFFQVFEEDPELAMFLRRLEAMEQLLQEKSTVVLSLDTEPFRLLKGRDPAIPAEGGSD
jgi:modulator of FtsH protease HflC